MKALPLVLAGSLLSACVTINVYFPAAAAERAADRIINDVWGPTPTPDQGAPPPEPQSGLGTPFPETALRIVLTALVPPAHAQADFDISTPAINAIKARMEKRHARLAPLYSSGVVGLTADGLIAARDLQSVPIKERQSVQQLVGEENADRKSLYTEIARANGHPEWEGDIRSTFAQRWIANARPGWLYQRPNGTWTSR